MNILGKRVVLRAMTKNDTDMVVRMFNNPDIERLVGGWSFPLSAEQHLRWFEAHMNGDIRNFVIDDSDFGAVGILRLSNLDWKNKNVTLGFKIDKKEHRGKGIGTDAYMAIIRYCFDELGLHRIKSSYLDFNAASQAVHKKCGFVEEGRMRESHYQNGRWVDLILTGLLEEEYRKLIRLNHYWD